MNFDPIWPYITIATTGSAVEISSIGDPVIDQQEQSQQDGQGGNGESSQESMMVDGRYESQAYVTLYMSTKRSASR